MTSNKLTKSLLIYLTILLLGFNTHVLACDNYYLDKDGNRIIAESIPIQYSADKTKKVIQRIKTLYYQKNQAQLPARIVQNLIAIQKQGAQLESIDDQYFNQTIIRLIKNMIKDETSYFVKLAKMVNFDFILTFEELKAYDKINRPPNDLDPDILKPEMDKDPSIFAAFNKQFVLDAAKEHKRHTSDYLSEIRY
ncbi:MAG: hypothetical protein HON94_07860 [Methylococcales bacterium]|jgi:hypothetical protein|nr:hypothetical protein [Methylococcales bacterium]MBT7409215.1 hypothetical protein [Methylococcales bacterium]